MNGMAAGAQLSTPATGERAQVHWTAEGKGGGEGGGVRSFVRA